MELRYLHRGFLPGVPARDLTKEEADRHGREYLIASGAYAENEKQSKPRPATNKAVMPEQNKESN